MDSRCSRPFANIQYIHKSVLLYVYNSVESSDTINNVNQALLPHTECIITDMQGTQAQDVFVDRTDSNLSVNALTGCWAWTVVPISQVRVSPILLKCADQLVAFDWQLTERSFELVNPILWCCVFWSPSQHYDDHPTMALSSSRSACRPFFFPGLQVALNNVSFQHYYPISSLCVSAQPFLPPVALLFLLLLDLQL